MLRDLWNRLMGRERTEAIRLKTERDQMSPDERHFSEESVEDIAAERFVGEHLGGVTDPDRLLDDDRPPRD